VQISSADLITKSQFFSTIHSTLRVSFFFFNNKQVGRVELIEFHLLVLLNIKLWKIV